MQGHHDTLVRHWAAQPHLIVLIGFNLQRQPYHLEMQCQRRGNSPPGHHRATAGKLAVQSLHHASYRGRSDCM